MTGKEAHSDNAMTRAVQLEKKWLARRERAEGMWAGLPEVDFIQGLEVPQLTEPVPVRDAHIRRRRSVRISQPTSASLAKPFIAHGQEVGIRPQGFLTRDRNNLAVESLQPNLEH